MLGSGAPKRLTISGAKIATISEKHDEAERDERDLVAAQAAPEELQRRARGDLAGVAAAAICSLSRSASAGTGAHTGTPARVVSIARY